MIVNGNNVLLFIEPKNSRVAKPIIDSLTVKMFNAFIAYIATGHLNSAGKFIENLHTMGHHTCICNATSTSSDYLLADGLATNYLCVHYVACHRDEILATELAKVAKLSSSEVLLEENRQNLYTMIG